MKLFELWVDLENLLPSFYFRLPYKHGLIHVVRGVLKLYYPCQGGRNSTSSHRGPLFEESKLLLR